MLNQGTIANTHSFKEMLTWSQLWSCRGQESGAGLD